MRQRRSDIELLNASRHVRYDVIQLDECIRRLALLRLWESDVLLYNSLLTAFSIYARSVYLFLYAANPRKDDIVADDYFDDAQTWLSLRPVATPLLLEMKAQADKLSAHLSYMRLGQPYEWMWIDIHTDMRNVLRQFVSLVPSHRLDYRLRTFESYWNWTDNLPNMINVK